MTEEGLKRIIELFLQDIAKMTYMQNDEQKEREILNSNIDGTTITMSFKIESNENGTFKDFKLVGKSGTVYAIKNISVNKIGDSMIHEFSFNFAVKEG